jgi:signal peptidase I
MKAALREVLETLALTALIFALVSSAFQTFKVEGRSMEPTLYDGQYLVINKAAYWKIEPNSLGRMAGLTAGTGFPEEGVSVFGEPQYGDIIVFKFPRDLSRPFIKRVIGRPGDTVEIRNGRVLINGEPLDEPYQKDVPRYQVGPEQVPARHYFVLGDNRNNSSDSHVWGMVPEDNILGKAAVRYWPLLAWSVALSAAPHFGGEPSSPAAAMGSGGKEEPR